MSTENGISNNGTSSTGVVITNSAHPLPEGVHLPLYMDNHATTPLDPRVLEAMMPYFTGKFGNAASRNHQFGWEAEAAVENARGQIAKLIGCTAKEIIFTSGATESNNLAIKGIAEMYRERGNHIITQQTEHKAVLDTCKKLEKMGYNVTYLPVQADGLINLEELKSAIVTEGPNKTILVTIMYANNEIGVIQPIREIGKLCHEKGVLFHTDAVQAVGKVPVDVQADNIDVLSLSGHKLYGPKESAPSTFAAATPASRSPSRSTVAATSAACVPARSTSPASSASAQPAKSAATRWPQKPPAKSNSATTSSRSSKLHSTTPRSTATWSTISPATSTCPSSTSKANRS